MVWCYEPNEKVKKISINLNPQKKNITSAVLQDILSYTPLVGLSAAAIFVVILLLQVFTLKKSHTVSVYNKEWVQWEDKADLIAKVKKEIIDLENERIVLQKLVTPKNDVALILENIFSSLPKNIWFDKIDCEEELVVLAGYVVRWQEDSLVSLDKFINALRKKEYFSSKFGKINIRESRVAKVNKVEVLEFSIECRK